LYGSLVVDSTIGCTTSGWYHGGMNMHRLGASHPKDPICGLKGGFPSKSPPNELPWGESPNCLPFGGSKSKPLGIWISKLVVTCIVVGIDAIIGYLISCLYLLVIGWTIVGNWFPTEYGIYVGGTIGCSSIVHIPTYITCIIIKD
jgi:hypothetical protein